MACSRYLKALLDGEATSLMIQVAQKLDNNSQYILYQFIDTVIYSAVLILVCTLISQTASLTSKENTLFPIANFPPI